MERIPAIERVKSDEEIPKFGPLYLDFGRRILVNNETGDRQRLNPQEYQILWLLFRAKGNILPPADIENFLYEDLPDDKDLPLSNVLGVRILSLRKKLEGISKGKVTLASEGGTKGFLGYTLSLNP